jgi:hypothetical protein
VLQFKFFFHLSNAQHFVNEVVRTEMGEVRDFSDSRENMSFWASEEYCSFEALELSEEKIFVLQNGVI